MTSGRGRTSPRGRALRREAVKHVLVRRHGDHVSTVKADGLPQVREVTPEQAGRWNYALLNDGISKRWITFAAYHDLKARLAQRQRPEPRIRAVVP